ncbi:T9SS type A sorting domain-containing protein [Spirosoma sp. HMF4905]|uniref:T9SS type A sorting domain-containing protein n=2 Tax=Spirosoma arboris TaxID=2682092 RepID=A0A7K1SL71_9BACT|nr:T9SS type A sorting domain-containing protein [Spirosoma arboris]
MYLGSHNGTILSSVDIVAHEYGHGVSNYLVGGWTPANLQSETRALNEGFSDIIATTIERELYPTGGTNQIWNYQIGEDVWLLRNMADPHSVLDFNVNPTKSYPQTYLESGFWDNNGEPHHNSSVISKWFHTLTTGSGPNGNNTASINFDVAMQIVYWGLDYYIYGDYNYPNTAQALRAAAGSLFGQCSPEQNAVIAALNAVNLSVGQCTPDCNYAAVNISPSSVNCNQGITLSANCTGATANNNVWTCQNVTYSFSGPNVPYNTGTSTSINITAPSNPGSYQYSLTLSKPNSGCYARTYNFNVSVNCSGGGNCDFSNGPRYVGTWNGLIVQIRQISGRNVLVTAIPNSPTDKYYPRGDNFWGNFTPDPGAVGLQSCLNAGNTDWYGFTFPTTISPPSGYYQGTEQDGAVFYSQNGTNPQNPCDVSPRHVGTWNGLNVEIRTFPNGKHALVTAVPGSSNDKYYVRGDNFWDNFTKDAGVDQYHDCLNAGITDWFGLTFPGGIYPPAGYQQGTSPDGAIYFSTNGLRVAATEAIEESVALVKFHPNPVQEELTLMVQLKEAGDIVVRLIDLQGRVQHKQAFKGIAGTNEQTISISSIATGIYALEVTLGNQRIIQKVVKQ